MRKVVRKGRVIKWLPILGGMLCSFIFLWFFGKTILEDEMFFGERLFGEMQYLDYNRIAYLTYLLKIRGAQIAFVIFMTCIRKKRAGLGIWAWMTGSGFGVGAYAMLQKWGIFGVPGYFMMMLPHYLCYFYSYSKYYKIDYMSQNQRRGNLAEGGGMVPKVVIIGVVIIGIFTECYVNPFFIKLFSKIFL